MKNILLFLSAFIPMYVLILLKQVMEMVFKNIKVDALNIIVLIFLALAIILGLLGLILEVKNTKQKSKQIVLVSANNITDQHFLGYFSLFVLFAITFDLSRLSMFIVFVLILIMIGVVYVKNKLFFINPFLNILGYNFYSIIYTHVNDKEEYKTHIFFKGQMTINNVYKVKIKDENFAFISKK